MRILFILLVYFSIIDNAYAKMNYTQIAHNVMYKHAKDMKKKFGIELIGSGGAMHHDVERIIMQYWMYCPLNISQAREIYVKIVEDLLHKINSENQLKPYLHNVPFTSKNTDIILGIFKNKKRDVNSDVSGITLYEGIVEYLKYDEQKKDLVPFMKESYEEAFNIVYGKN